MSPELKAALERMKSVQAKAQEALKSGTLGEELRAELRSATEDYTTVQKAEEALALGKAGDDARAELEDAARHDARRGQVQTLADGKPFYPTVNRVAGQLSMLAPMPEGIENSPLNKYLHIPTADADIKEMQRSNDLALMAKMMTGKTIDQLPLTKGLIEREIMTRANEIDAPANTGFGAEWAPEFFSADYVETIYLAAGIAGLFRVLAMPRRSVVVPQILNRPTPYLTAGAKQNTQWGNPLTTPEALGSGTVTFEAKRIQTIIGISEEMEEDAAFMIVPPLRDASAVALAIALDDAIMNGSTSLTDLDNDSTGKELWTSTADPRYAWNGLRKWATTANTKVDGGGSVDIEGLADTKKAMGMYGTSVFRGDCAWIVGIDAEADIMALDSFLTMDKLGPNASLVTGQIGSIFGIPVVVSGVVYGPAQGIGLNASGVWDDTTKTKSILQLVNRRGFWLGDRRQVRFETDTQKSSGMTNLITSWRGDFQGIYPSGETATATLYNI